MVVALVGGTLSYYPLSVSEGGTPHVCGNTRFTFSCVLDDRMIEKIISVREGLVLNKGEPCDSRDCICWLTQRNFLRRNLAAP
jgi:hypothetical protein